MEYRFIAQQQLALFGNIYLAIFCITLIIFFITIFLSTKRKVTFKSQLLIYTSLIISAIAFTTAVLISNYKPYTSEFTEEIFKIVQLYSYGILTIIATLIISAIGLSLRRNS